MNSTTAGAGFNFAKAVCAAAEAAFVIGGIYSARAGINFTPADANFTSADGDSTVADGFSTGAGVRWIKFAEVAAGHV